MSRIVVSDSSSNLLVSNRNDYKAVPLRIITSQKAYVDDLNVNVDEMIEDLKKYHGKSTTSCPSSGEWLDAFGDNEEIFAVTITSGLSGSYNSAMSARDSYLEMHPDRKVYVIDSLSAGPGLTLIIEKLFELIDKGLSFEEIVEEIKEYQKNQTLFFLLSSVKNLANNGRAGRAAALAVGVLGIKVLGKANEVGQIDVLDKSRNLQNAIKKIVDKMVAAGLKDGKLIIAECHAEDAARKLVAAVKETIPNVKASIMKTTALCSFYAEEGGLMIAFEHC